MLKEDIQTKISDWLLSKLGAIASTVVVILGAAIATALQEVMPKQGLLLIIQCLAVLLLFVLWISFLRVISLNKKINSLERAGKANLGGKDISSDEYWILKILEYLMNNEGEHTEEEIASSLEMNPRQAQYFLSLASGPFKKYVYGPEIPTYGLPIRYGITNKGLAFCRQYGRL